MDQHLSPDPHLSLHFNPLKCVKGLGRDILEWWGGFFLVLTFLFCFMATCYWLKYLNLCFSMLLQGKSSPAPVLHFQKPAPAVVSEMWLECLFSCVVCFFFF